MVILFYMFQILKNPTSANSLLVFLHVNPQSNFISFKDAALKKSENGQKLSGISDLARIRLNKLTSSIIHTYIIHTYKKNMHLVKVTKNMKDSR